MFKKPVTKTKAGKRTRRHAGFTLTEVVVASALLISAMVPILRGLTSVHLTGAVVERRTMSLNFAQAKLDDIKARSIYNFGTNYNESDTAFDTDYFYKVEITSPGANLKKITVKAGFDLNSNNILNNDEILVKLETLIARRW
jgi:type II secretory pathway pseudopilin PulG